MSEGFKGFLEAIGISKKSEPKKLGMDLNRYDYKSVPTDPNKPLTLRDFTKEGERTAVQQNLSDSKLYLQALRINPNYDNLQPAEKDQILTRARERLTETMDDRLNLQPNETQVRKAENIGFAEAQLRAFNDSRPNVGKPVSTEDGAQEKVKVLLEKVIPSIPGKEIEVTRKRDQLSRSLLGMLPTSFQMYFDKMSLRLERKTVPA